MIHRTLSATGLLLLLAANGWAQGDFDRVYLYEGPLKSGTIVEMSKDEIGVEVSGGVVTKAKVGNVKRVMFADAPPMLTSALAAISSGQLEDALEKLQKIEKSDIQRKVVADEVDFYIAYCMAKLALAGGGDKAAAASKMIVFAQDAGNYHYYEANEITGDLALGLGHAEDAAKFYKNVSSAPWPEYKVRAAVLEGNAMLGQEKYAEARDQYDKVIRANLNTTQARRQKEFAALGKAKCLGKLGDSAEGIKLCEKTITNGDSRDYELFSRAYNALGACYLAAGKSKDALLAYLHVDLLFYQDPAQHAEALYYLIDLWRTDNKTERSIKARALLRDRYPGSVWAGKAS